MSENKKPTPSQKTSPQPLTEERGLRPTRNPPPMPQVKPPKQEKST
ncbi:hypothetical protein SAMN05421644_12022 [Allochromatium warmingii]|uniref:Uncharacterized protein n=1 Tax=Allochromatium warmingii TaxID=61595 RepID=A0A1H3FPS5_ALLWA|nr:hypothetical protein SAMN05421644_12022 [Allochromatium warmingii]